MHLLLPSSSFASVCPPPPAAFANERASMSHLPMGPPEPPTFRSSGSSSNDMPSDLAHQGSSARVPSS
eukprot:5256648-Pyramimonas_sp.AAC.1